LMTSPAQRRRLPLPRFSLRMLLLAFTAVAIGFPVWYRWPYVEESDIWETGGRGVTERWATTWQRKWGGGRWKHGAQTTYRKDGSKRYVFHYLRDELHGRYEAWEPGGELDVVGYMEHEQKSGTWTIHTNSVSTTQTWKEDQLDGPYELRWPNGRIERMVFTQGRLTEVNGRPWLAPFYDSHHRRETRDESQAIDDNLYSNLNSPTTYEFQNVPLSSAMYAISSEQVLGLPQESSSTPVLLDPRLRNPHLPLTCRLDGLDVKTALVLLLAKHGLVADYHYGAVWVTTPELTGPWPDPTGIDQIDDPVDLSDPFSTALSRELINVWEKPVDVTTTWRTPTYPGEQALADVIAEAFGPLMIEIDTSRIAPTQEEPNRFPVVAYLHNIPFRHALAYLLYQAKCRCKLEGETLVILPPDEQPASSGAATSP
jgi:hypothetical protein